ncbi:hypothetical protein PIB30_087602 [Stylosanthes scabra]|uniref:Uncharacterized protein n=1 Tax=Stylosanthes scabra TaxID=79078 RepID=A0ABU6XW03_9FABA|nr:hypothetical protein [Stylosanthes scabra]
MNSGVDSNLNQRETETEAAPKQSKPREWKSQKDYPQKFIIFQRIARTKTTNRNTDAQIHPPSTRSARARASHEPFSPLEQPPPSPPPTSARPNSARGKRPMTEEAPPPLHITEKDLRAERRAIEEEERRSRASTNRTRKSKGSGIKLLVIVVRELIQEVINMVSCISTTMEKSKSRANVLERYLNKLEDDHEFSESDEEEDEDENVSNAN